MRYNNLPFARDLGTTIAAPPGKEFAPEELKAALEVKIPLFFEDEGLGVGLCRVRGKRGAFGRCVNLASEAHRFGRCDVVRDDPQLIASRSPVPAAVARVPVAACGS